MVKLAHTILVDPATVSIAPETTTAEKVEQSVCFAERENKRPLLIKRLSEQKDGELTIVFARTKHGSDKLARMISKEGFAAEAIHGNRSQPQRDRTLEKFRQGKIPVLVATDVAARGVDVKAVTLVVNFDLPNEPEAYVHRIGRTGRAGATGHAVSFCCADERDYLRDIEKLIGNQISVDSEHDWHLASLAADHLRFGNRSNGVAKIKQGNRSGGGRSGGGGGRRPSAGSSSGGSNSGGGGGGGGGNRRRRRGPRRAST